jgi:CRP/FNR family transcriptional regulator, cyclic AMP receptor protein
VSAEAVPLPAVAPPRPGDVGVLLPPGPLLAPLTAAGPRFAVLRAGVVLKVTTLRDRDVVELLGPGDVLDLRPDDEPCTLPTTTSHEVLRRAALAPVPATGEALHAAVQAQLAAQCRRASAHLAALSLPRVEDRLHAVFCDLADRFGRVRPDGLVIDLPLTHRLLGRLVGARRPTISLALRVLADAGVLDRREDGAWVLRP